MMDTGSMKQLVGASFLIIWLCNFVCCQEYNSLVPDVLNSPSYFNRRRNSSFLSPWTSFYPSNGKYLSKVRPSWGSTPEQNFLHGNFGEWSQQDPFLMFPGSDFPENLNVPHPYINPSLEIGGEIEKNLKEMEEEAKVITKMASRKKDLQGNAACQFLNLKKCIREIEFLTKEELLHEEKCGLREMFFDCMATQRQNPCQKTAKAIGSVKKLREKAKKLITDNLSCILPN